MWQRCIDNDIQFYQQPAGFEDALIVSWKIRKQGKLTPCSISVKDMFAGGLADEARHSQFLFNQLAGWVLSKMTAALQVTDTDVAFRMKAIMNRKLEDLRHELLRLANLENARPVFKCCVYEIMRVICETVEELRDVFNRDQTLRKAMIRNGWLAVRPKVSEGRFVRVSEETWATYVPLGTHRLRRSWCQRRFENLDENGMPRKPEG